MDISTLTQALLLFVFPALVLWLLEGRPVSRWLSPVVVCFVAGIASGTFCPGAIHAELMDGVQEATIALAIPLLVMTADFIRWLPRFPSVAFAFAVSCTGVLFGALATFFIFRPFSDSAWLVSSMLFAGYTGTIANANAVGNALDCPRDILLLVNMGDMLSGAAYLVLLTSVAHPLLSRWLPAYRYDTDRDGHPQIPSTGQAGKDAAINHITRQNIRELLGNYVKPAVYSGFLLLVSLGLEHLFYPASGLSGTFILISLTILGIASSFIRPVRTMAQAYTTGQYLLLVFCLALGTMINIQDMLRASPVILTHAALMMAISVTVHYCLAKWCRIDADTAMITSTATIYGPAFIGQVAMAVRNREMIFPGMIASMMGIAAGNFLGLGLALLLKMAA